MISLNFAGEQKLQVVLKFASKGKVDQMSEFIFPDFFQKMSSSQKWSKQDNTENTIKTVQNVYQTFTTESILKNCQLTKKTIMDFIKKI